MDSGCFQEIKLHVSIADFIQNRHKYQKARMRKRKSSHLALNFPGRINESEVEYFIVSSSENHTFRVTDFHSVTIILSVSKG